MYVHIRTRSFQLTGTTTTIPTLARDGVGMIGLMKGVGSVACLGPGHGLALNPEPPIA